MLQVIFIFNVIIMFLFWSACMVTITPAYNHFIQYGETGGMLPVLTQLAIDARFFMLSIPFFWAIISFWVYRRIRERQKENQFIFVLFFAMLSISTGFLMLIFYGLAGILPFLMIGVDV